MAKESFSKQMRKILDLSFKRKPFWFFLLLPILIIISYVIALVAKIRRRQIAPAFPEDVKIICVGNIIVGGTGKSPIVQKIAQDYLKKGYVVAIAARGITDYKKPVYIHAQQFSSREVNLLSHMNLLSDENREHYELLKFKKLSQNLYILQNSNRYEALNYFKEQIKHLNPNLKAVFILDDGLQHFACPRHENICVWQPDILLNSPNFSMPVGPYREGFGKKSLQKLLTGFDKRIWSRTTMENFHDFEVKVKECLNKYSLNLCEKDIFACYEFKVVKIEFKNNEFHLQACETVYNQVKSASVVTGIAHGDKFKLDLKNYFIYCQEWTNLNLEDHASFPKNRLKIQNILGKNKVCIFTLKDFFRWQHETLFREMLRDKTIYGCFLELELRTLFLAQKPIIDLI